MTYSIITPVYNREDCISRCIESVCRNLNPNIDFEHIIVDDGSSDNTVNIVNDYAKKYSHIKLVVFEHNRGTNAARNAAIENSKGDYCIILDSDDYFVDDALKTIDNVVSINKYRHYCFSPDDMVETYSSNNILSGKNSYVIKYEDFLLERISGDFIHVIDRNVLLKYPFFEDLRINEGVFFKRFYREEKEILFTNKIVTIRERSRQDSVTRTVLRNDKEAVKRTIKANILLLEWFANDLNNYQEGKNIINKTLIRLIDNELILGDYSNAQKHIKALGKNILPFRLKVIYNLRLSWLYYDMGCLYVFLKYQVLNKKIK